MGHTYWEVVAVRPAKGLRGDPTTKVMQRCRHCGKLRTCWFDGDWTDYADGIYDDVPREKPEAR